MFNLFRKNKTIDEKFKVIKLIPGQNYYPASQEGKGNDLSKFEGLLNTNTLSSISINTYEDSIVHTKIDLPLGKSRYGGSIIDLPEGENIPEELNFAAHLNLTELTIFDETGLLPKNGHLIIFADIKKEIGKIIFTDVNSNKLKRVIKEHTDDFYTGVIIESAYASTEFWCDRFRRPEDNWEKENLKHLFNKDGLIWDEFAGSKDSKIYGILTHCQYSQKDIEKIMKDDTIVLLQIGEDGFNDEGVFSVTISKKDLIARKFENCTFIGHSHK